jgi:hypothetical protein
MRLYKAALCLFALGAVMNAAVAREVGPYQAYGDAVVTSVMAQRTFAGVLPSIADYSQTAHSVLKDGEYCPADSLSGASYCQPGARWVMWDTPFMQFDSVDGHGNYAGRDMDMTGFGTGIGRMLSDTTVLGIAAGWDMRKTDLDTSLDIRQNDWLVRGKVNSDTFHAALYGGTAIGCFFVDAYAGYSRTWHRSRIDRTDTPLPNFTKATSKFDDAVYSAGVKASYVWILPNEMRLTASLGLDYAHASQDSAKQNYYVNGARNPDWHLKKTTGNSFQTPIHVALNKTFQSDILSFGGKPSWWTPEIRTGLVPQFGSGRVAGKVVGDNGTIHEYKSAEYESYGTIGAGVKIKLRDKYIFAVDYDYRFGRDYNSHLVTGTYGVSF